MGPTFAPVGNDGDDTHDFPEDEEPQHMSASTAWSEAGANPGTKYRDEYKKRGARHEGIVRGNAALDEISGEYAGEQRVGCKNKDYRQEIAANHDGQGFQHGPLLLAR